MAARVATYMYVRVLIQRISNTKNSKYILLDCPASPHLRAQGQPSLPTHCRVLLRDNMGLESSTNQASCIREAMGLYSSTNQAITSTTGWQFLSFYCYFMYFSHSDRSNSRLLKYWILWHGNTNPLAPWRRSSQSCKKSLHKHTDRFWNCPVMRSKTLTRCEMVW